MSQKRIGQIHELLAVSSISSLLSLMKISFVLHLLFYNWRIVSVVWIAGSSLVFIGAICSHHRSSQSYLRLGQLLRITDDLLLLQTTTKRPDIDISER